MNLGPELLVGVLAVCITGWCVCIDQGTCYPAIEKATAEVSASP